ncbi:hypothetical protein [Mesorhizobium delmotii]|uniref:hypothetical protein n=1 Tax=Mesorhizobium delmotii TaxID=1631247 RepID=UPI0010581BA1|nr:hypothetical protein [Mesorhizobium delmotii]
MSDESATIEGSESKALCGKNIVSWAAAGSLRLVSEVVVWSRSARQSPTHKMKTKHSKRHLALCAGGAAQPAAKTSEGLVEWSGYLKICG